MPIYVFKCGDCGKEFESLMRPTDPVECPKCKMRSCTKLITTHKGYTISGDNSASTRPRSGGK